MRFNCRSSFSSNSDTPGEGEEGEMSRYSRLTPGYNTVMTHSQNINGMVVGSPYIINREAEQQQMTGLRKDDKYWERRR